MLWSRSVGVCLRKATDLQVQVNEGERIPVVYKNHQALKKVDFMECLFKRKIIFL